MKQIIPGMALYEIGTEYLMFGFSNPSPHETFVDPTPFNTLFERNYRAHSFVISTDGPWHHTHYEHPVVTVMVAWPLPFVRGEMKDLVMTDQAAFAQDLPHHEPCGHSQLTKWRHDKWLKEWQKNRMLDEIIAEALDTAGNKFAGCFNHGPEFCACGRRHDQHFSFSNKINAQPWEKPSPQELDGLIDKVREAWTPDAPS